MSGALTAFSFGLSWREKVALVGVRIEQDCPTVETPVKHIFEPGMYIREITIPAGTLCVGRPHRFGHLVRFFEGRVRLIEEGSERFIEPPFEMFTRPGFVMVLETMEPHRGRTYHPNPYECRDVELMESLIFHSADEVRQRGLAVQKLLESP
jgi:hypothetical protein